MTSEWTRIEAAAARETAERVVAYEREEGRGRDDAFRTPEDVRAYEGEFGWLDDAEDDLSDLDEWQLAQFEALVTELVVDALFN